MDAGTAPERAFTAAEALAMDRWLVGERAFSIQELMASAGARLAAVVRELAAVRGRARLVFLVGPGNNGGDALVAERALRGAYRTLVWRPLAGDPTPAIDADTLVVDGLFGVGLGRPIGGPARAAVQAINASGAQVLAVDIPSGLSATTGEVVGVTGADPDGGVAVRADATLTFVGPKRGFFLGAGPGLVGTWSAAEIGFPAREAWEWLAARRARRGRGRAADEGATPTGGASPGDALPGDAPPTGG